MTTVSGREGWVVAGMVMMIDACEIADSTFYDNLNGELSRYVTVGWQGVGRWVASE